MDRSVRIVGLVAKGLYTLLLATLARALDAPAALPLPGALGRPHRRTRRKHRAENFELLDVHSISSLRVDLALTATIFS